MILCEPIQSAKTAMLRSAPRRSRRLHAREGGSLEHQAHKIATPRSRPEFPRTAIYGSGERSARFLGPPILAPVFPVRHGRLGAELAGEIIEDCSAVALADSSVWLIEGLELMNRIGAVVRSPSHGSGT
jgi:hypothetical protein